MDYSDLADIIDLLSKITQKFKKKINIFLTVVAAIRTAFSRRRDYETTRISQ